MLIPPADAPIPTPEVLEAELHALVRRRQEPRLDPDGALLNLAVVAHRSAAATGPAREAAFVELLPQIAARVGGQAHATAAISLLGLTGQLRRSPPGARREAAADALRIGAADSFRRRHERPLIADLATAIIQAEAAFRSRSRELDPELIDWPGRFAAYGRLYTPISAIGGDLEILIRAQHEQPDKFDYLIGQLGSSLWFYSQLLLAVEDFEQAYGGIWLLSTPEVETDTANALTHILRHPALHEHDHSWLRITLRQTPDHELDPFLDRIATTTRGTEILAAWVNWCQSCRCPSIAVPERSCEVHAVIAACQDYTQNLDCELRDLGQPLRQQLRDIPAARIRQIIKRFGATR